MIVAWFFIVVIRIFFIQYFLPLVLLLKCESSSIFLVVRFKNLGRFVFVLVIQLFDEGCLFKFIFFIDFYFYFKSFAIIFLISHFTFTFIASCHFFFKEQALHTYL